MTKGIKLAFLTAIISGFSIFYGKIAVTQFDPLVFTTLKNGLVAIFLSLILLTRKTIRPQNINWKQLITIGLIGGGLPFALFFTGLSKTSAINAALIHKTLFIWVAILAIPMLGEKLTKLQIAGYVLIFLSNFLIGGFKGFSLNSGELMILGATLLWAVENIIAKKTLQNVSPVLVAWARMTFGLLTLLVIIAYQGQLTSLINLSPSQLQIGLISASLLTGYVLTWYKALSKAPATIVSSILVLATIITNVLTVIFIDHKIPQFDLNTLLIISGIALISLFRPSFEKQYL